MENVGKSVAAPTELLLIVTAALADAAIATADKRDRHLSEYFIGFLQFG
jgi:hypothetical protein